jgi:hypothetical protein
MRSFAIVVIAALFLAGCSANVHGSPNASLPNGHQFPALEALLPSTISGAPLQKVSATGADEWGEEPWSISMTGFLAQHGKTPRDFRYAQAWDPENAEDPDLGVFQVPGLDAAVLLPAVVDASRPATAGLTTSTDTIGGKPVTIETNPSGAPPLYLYAHGDTLYYVGTEDAGLASDFLAGLP